MNTSMSPEHQRVISATPSASIQPSHERALAQLDPVAVASVAVDTSQPWWRRRVCARSLVGRLPDESALALWGRVTDTDDVAEVRIAGLSALMSSTLTATTAITRAEVLAWLRSQADAESPYGMGEAVILARCTLGDPTVAPQLARLTYDPWSHRADIAREALAALLADHGAAPLLDQFGATSLSALATAGPSAEARYLGLELVRRDDPADLATMIIALEDADPVVAHRAAQHLRDSPASNASLLTIFDEREADLQAAATVPAPLTGRPAAACRALVLVAQRCSALTGGEREALELEVRSRLSAVGGCEVPLPKIPKDVREAILAAHLPGERTTDPRHLLAGLGLGLEQHDLDARPELPQQAREALVAAGIEAGEPIPIGVVHQQGGGSYDLLEVEGQQLGVCTFGPFVRGRAPLSTEATVALESAGFRLIDDRLAAEVFDGLPVYYFGSREPLTVQDLLFYWQD